MGAESHSLAERLTAAAVRSTEDPVSAWKQLRAVEGKRATVIDLYRIVAEPRGLRPHELPLHERHVLSRAAMDAVWPGFEVTEGSERADPIEVVDYDPTWPARFDRWRSSLIQHLGEVARRIEHVGSTSVPGLAAKPVVDIQVSVDSLTDEELYVGPLERAGVQLRSRDHLHRYFRPFPDQPREVHIHVCEVGSAWEREHLLFRDYLRSHPRQRDEYAEVKKVAAEVWAGDRWGYTEAKTETVLRLLEDAERWAATNGWDEVLEACGGGGQSVDQDPVDDGDLVRRGYDSAAASYARARDLDESRDQLERFCALLPPPASVLDIGCGSGVPVDRYLVDRGYEVSGIDVSATQVELARANVPEGRFEVKDMLELEPGECVVDGVVSFYAIFHTPRERHAELLQTIASLLQPGGVLLVTMGAREYEALEENFHGVEMYWSHYGPRENRHLVESSGFTVEVDDIQSVRGERHQVILARKKQSGAR